ncbi:MAG TPA: Gfo/Idh/MocA family oxidoreductase [Chloroflexota bacterium]|nr:Gfo/Idh/MocA family oxidoreductase [Chloroflexota bacterium]
MHRIGLAGFGSIAEHGHLPALQSFPEIEVVAVADISPERLARAGQLLFAAQLYSSPEEMIAHAGIDGIDICTPPAAHAELMVAACRRGLPTIVCEKPFVLGSDEYRRVAAAREAAGSRIVSVNNWIHSDLYKHVCAIIDGGTIGRVQRIVLRTERPQAARGNQAWLPGWRTDLVHAGGGIILDHGWHQLYLVMGWLGGAPHEVKATTRTADARHLPVEDEATVELDFPSAEARIELAWTGRGRANSGEVVGTTGRIAIYDGRIVVHNGESDREMPFSGRLTESSYHPDWFRELIRMNVLDVDRSEADRNFAEAGTLVATVEAIYRSAEAQGEPRRPELERLVAPAGEAGEKRREDVYSGSRYSAEQRRGRVDGIPDSGTHRGFD